MFVCIQREATQTRVIPNYLLKCKLFCSVKKEVSNKPYPNCYETTKLVILRLRPTYTKILAHKLHHSDQKLERLTQNVFLHSTDRIPQQ